MTPTAVSPSTRSTSPRSWPARRTAPQPRRRRGRFHELEVAVVRPLTADSVEVTFAVPPELQDAYAFLPGQYVALRAGLGSTSCFALP